MCSSMVFVSLHIIIYIIYVTIWFNRVYIFYSNDAGPIGPFHSLLFEYIFNVALTIFQIELRLTRKAIQISYLTLQK